jgi:4-methyl-5(b-hydroxyethyl)-thiazole monophosphate biosynthesis
MPAHKRVLLLFCRGTEIFEAAAFYDVLGWSGDCGYETIEVVTAASHKLITCTFGMKVQVDQLVSEIDVEDFDALAIPGGFEEFGFYDDAYSDLVQSFITQFVTNSKPVATICVGALPLAKTGALQNRPATTYHLGEGRRRSQLAALGARVVDAPIVQDGLFITSTAPVTATEVAFRLLGMLTSDSTMQAIRQQMGFSIV